MHMHRAPHIAHQNHMNFGPKDYLQLYYFTALYIGRVCVCVQKSLIPLNYIRFAYTIARASVESLMKLFTTLLKFSIFT